jgi:hypothetical protein
MANLQRQLQDLMQQQQVAAAAVQQQQAAAAAAQQQQVAAAAAQPQKVAAAAQNRQNNPINLGLPPLQNLRNQNPPPLRGILRNQILPVRPPVGGLANINVPGAVPQLPALPLLAQAN